MKNPHDIYIIKCTTSENILWSIFRVHIDNTMVYEKPMYVVDSIIDDKNNWCHHEWLSEFDYDGNMQYDIITEEEAFLELV
jgi:hypothetical protein